jgi:mxaJ protein
MTYDIAIGVRKSDAGLASEINEAIERRRGEIDAILKAYGVPRTDAATRVGAVP